MARQIKCLSCGASVKVRRGEFSTNCPYCDSSVMVPDETWGGRQEAMDRTVRESVTEHVTINTVDPSRAARSCRAMAISLAILMVAGAAMLVFFLARSNDAIDSVARGIGERIGGDSVGSSDGWLEFGGTGTGPGLFTEARCVGTDSRGRIYVGEMDTGRIQLFESDGTYITQWSFGSPEDRWLTAMAVSRNGTVYIVTGSELYIYDGETGDSLGMLEHPDGWGFDDVTACADGSVLATWYKNRDDIIRFDRNGRMDLLIGEAISGQSGDSELSTLVAADGLGNIFAFGEFTGSVFKFSEEGRFITRFGIDGDRPGQFTAPSCIATDNVGNLWVNDFGEMIVFDGTGFCLGTLDLGLYLYDMVIGDGDILVGVTTDDHVVVVDLSAHLADL